MKIDTLRDGTTYVGFSFLMTSEEWRLYCKGMYKQADDIPYERARKMGGMYTASCDEHGRGFIFPKETPESLEQKAKSMFPWLF